MKKAGETKRKKVERQQTFYKSYAWKKIRAAALERAGHQCEFVALRVRCPETERLHGHHVHGAKFGGNEQPGDVVMYCKAHHEFVERRDFPHRQRHGRAS